MTSHTLAVEIPVDNEQLAGTILSPPTRLPGILFVHGWGGSQQRDISRAEEMAALGCICMTFDLRGHEKTLAQRQTVNRAHNLADVLAAHDQLAAQRAIDPGYIGVIGTSYGGYLAAMLAAMRNVRWLVLRAPALYRDEGWGTPKQLLDRADLMAYRRASCLPADNRALKACAGFSGDVLIVESEHDDFIPHETIMNYRSAFAGARSLTHRIIEGADHALSSDTDQKSYSRILDRWVSEMITGARKNESH